MNVSINWLKELVPGLESDAETIAHDFSMKAAAVEGFERIGDSLDDIVVAKVLEVAPHPNADRLSLCIVDAGGDDPIRVVCGAPVIVEGALYPYVPVGATLPAGFTIDARKIRGEMSHGMLCSEIELELGRDKSGIMRLAHGLEPGTPLTEALGLPDTRLGLDLNPNRVDLACQMGVAREFLAAGESLRERDFGTSWSPDWADGEAEASGAGLAIRIESPDRCPRYLGAVVRGVRIGPSPAWLAGRLLAMGAHPINNVVDATNYVLLERNQPLHAFDLSTLRGGRVSVRAAGEGEKLVTLDGETRTLSAADTVIADDEGAIALAGVMGGADSEVTADTVDLLIECAAFDPLSVRKTARSVGLSTDASYRFERGIDETAQEEALARCVELILAIAGGEADPVGVRVGAPAMTLPDVSLRAGRVTAVLGLELDDDAIAALLEPLGFERRGSENGAVVYGVPGWRRDVTREIDLVEEVARRYGYDNFPDIDRRFRPSAVPEHPGFDRAERARELLTARGLLESRSLSFMPEVHRGNRSTVPVPNPLSAEESFLRGAMVPVLLRRLEHNYSRGRRDVRLFEIGTVFGLSDEEAVSGDAATAARSAGLGKYTEEARLALLLTGRRHPSHWEGSGSDVDLWDLKALAEEVSTRLCDAVLEPLTDTDSRADELGGAWLGRERFRIVRDGRTLGVAGPVASVSLDAPPWAAPVWGVEMELDAIVERGVTRYRPTSAYPAVSRDLAITAPTSVAAADVEATVEDVTSDLLESAKLFDVYEGEEIGEGRRSLGWAFRFRADDRTLTDEDVEAEMKAISAALEERFDARIRTS